MTGNGKHTTYKNGDDWGMGYHCFHHINQAVMDLGVSVDLIPYNRYEFQRQFPMEKRVSSKSSTQLNSI